MPGVSGFWWALAFCLVGLGLLVVLTRAVFFVVDVQGQSMTPALTDGERVLVLRIWPARCLRRGQIAITTYTDTPWLQQHPNVVGAQKYIKRVTGLVGDVVLVERPSLPRPSSSQSPEMAERRVWHVPPGHYFVRGDSWGLDSTVVGPVPFRMLRGVVIMKLKRPVDRALGPGPNCVSNNHRLE